MRVTIIKDDNAVNVDGERHTVNCTDLPADFHALQWNGVRGEVEYNMTVCAHCAGRSKKPNEIISDLTPYQKYVDAWNVAKAAEVARVDALNRDLHAALEKAKADAAGQ